MQNLVPQEELYPIHRDFQDGQQVQLGGENLPSGSNVQLYNADSQETCKFISILASGILANLNGYTVFLVDNKDTPNVDEDNLVIDGMTGYTF